MQERRAWLKRVSLRWIEGPLLEGAAAVHVTSDLERDEVESLGLKARCVTIPLGLPRVAESGNFRPLTSIFPQLADKPIVLFLSRLDKKKNVEGLIEAFSMIAADIPDCVLLVAGTGDPRYVRQLKEIAIRSAAAERILWLGHVERELKAAAFAAAKLFVLPSYSENFGIAAAEALAAGVPCLLGDGVALAETVAATGAGLATSTDAVSVATAMRLILANESRRVEMSTRARELAEREYSSPVMASRLTALYNRIIAASAEGDDVSGT